jgi:hypothetical protein
MRYVWDLRGIVWGFREGDIGLMMVDEVHFIDES